MTIELYIEEYPLMDHQVIKLDTIRFPPTPFYHPGLGNKERLTRLCVSLQGFKQFGHT